LITASSAGIIDSPPSRPKRLVPTYLRARNFSHCSAWTTLVRIDCLPSRVKTISASLPSIGRHVALGEAERIEVGGEMAAHPVGADQHHRADRIPGGLLDVGAARRGGLARFGDDLLDRHLHRIERRVELVELGHRPIGARPARALLTLAVGKYHVQLPFAPTP